MLEKRKPKEGQTEGTFVVLKMDEKSIQVLENEN